MVLIMRCTMLPCHTTPAAPTSQTGWQIKSSVGAGVRPGMLAIQHASLTGDVLTGQSLHMRHSAPDVAHSWRADWVAAMQVSSVCFTLAIINSCKIRHALCHPILHHSPVHVLAGVFVSLLCAAVPGTRA